MVPVWKSKFYGAFVLKRRADLHAIDAAPARWRGGVGLTARRSHASDSLFDFRTVRERRRRQGHRGLDDLRPAVSLALYILSSTPLCLYCRRARTPRPVRAAPPRREHLAHTNEKFCPSSRLTQHPLPCPSPGAPQRGAPRPKFHTIAQQACCTPVYIVICIEKNQLSRSFESSQTRL